MHAQSDRDDHNPPADVPPALSALSRLTAAVSHLEDVAEILEHRVGSVLAPPAPRAVDPEAESGAAYSSMVTSELLALSRRVERLVGFVADLTERVEF